MLDRNTSPVGWYIGTYLIRFVELNDRNDDEDSRHRVWENTKLIKAKDLGHAYDELVKVAQLEAQPYRGGPDGVPVQWVFEGVVELLPIYEELENGAELMYKEHTHSKLKNLRKRVRNKKDFFE